MGERDGGRYGLGETTSMWAEEWPLSGGRRAEGQSEKIYMLLNYFWLISEASGKTTTKPLSKNLGKQQAESELSPEGMQENPTDIEG